MMKMVFKLCSIVDEALMMMEMMMMVMMVFKLCSIGMHFKNAWVCLLPAGALNRYSKELQQSTHNPGLVDQPLDAAAWLARFREMNAPVLQEVQVCGQIINYKG